MQNRQLTRRNFLLRLGGSAGLLSSSLFALPVFAAPAGELTGAKLSGTTGNLTVSFMLSAEVGYKVFTLKAPDRVVIDLQRTAMKGSLKAGQRDRPPLKGIRYATHDDGLLRIVLDLSQAVEMTSDLKKQGNQYVLSVNVRADGVETVKRNDTTRKTAAKKETPRKNLSPNPGRTGDFVVVIDPGHGGRDPGAIGKNGTFEKDVVLAVSRRLKSRIDAAPGMRAIMTRDGDKYIPLRKRIEIARRNKADLFISVHADANPRRSVRGSSVYILSENGASSEAARLLAQSENGSYELGSLQLAGNDDVNSVLLDLSQNETIDRSLELANTTLKELSRISNPLRPRVESAGFVVLKAPDIPSVLVETAFISNPREEKRLRTASYQQKLADAMFKGVKQYKIAHGANPKSQQFVTAVRRGPESEYVVRSGDSLSEIAERHGVPISTIKRVNKLRSSNIRIGQKLRIPTNT